MLRAIKLLVGRPLSDGRFRVGVAGFAIFLMGIFGVAGGAMILSLEITNAEIGVRGRENIELATEKSSNSTITIYVHELHTETNSASVSVVVEQDPPNSESVKEGKCGHLEIMDRAQSEGKGTRWIKLPCHLSRRAAHLSFETDTFNVQVIAGNSGYPSDTYDLMMFVDAFDGDDLPVKSNLKIVKLSASRVMRVSHPGLNWQVSFVRPLTDRVYICASAVLFVLLTVGVSVLMWRAPIDTAGEVMLAVASYLIAAAGFRSMLGFDKVANTTSFEIAVFGLPMLLLGFSVLWVMMKMLLSSRTAKTS